MNKTDARKFAQRMVAGIIEQIFHASPRQKTIPIDPLVYDHAFVNTAKEHRMSAEDEDRVWDALYDIGQDLSNRGAPFPKTEKYVIGIPLKRAIPDGVIGKKWAGYRDLRERQGWVYPKGKKKKKK